MKQKKEETIHLMELEESGGSEGLAVLKELAGQGESAALEG